MLKHIVRHRGSEKVPVARPDGTMTQRERRGIVVTHVDIIGDLFWEQHPEIMAD